MPNINKITVAGTSYDVEDKKAALLVTNYYDSSQSYQEGDYCIYNRLLYKCNGNTTGSFDSSKWDQTTVIDELGSGGGGEAQEYLDGLIQRTLTSFEGNQSYIGEHAFFACSSLTSVNVPKCTSIGNNAFGNCYSLPSVSFPECTTIGINAFFACVSLTSVNFPKCTTIGNSAFQYCSSLTSANFPKCTIIGSSAFGYCYSLTSVSFPECTTIGSNAFSYCSKLTSVSFPECTTIGDYAFRSCRLLTSVYLLASSRCTLANSNAFSMTSIWSNKGSIFVPSSLVASYKTATNWKFFSDRIFAAP